MPETERMEKGLGYGSVSPVFTADLGTRVQSPRLSEKLGTVVCACNPSTGRQRPAAPWAEHQAAERFCLKDQLVASWKTTPKVAFCSPHVCTQRGGGGKEREEKTIEWRALSDRGPLKGLSSGQHDRHLNLLPLTPNAWQQGQWSATLALMSQWKCSWNSFVYIQANGRRNWNNPFRSWEAGGGVVTSNQSWKTEV